MVKCHLGQMYTVVFHKGVCLVLSCLSSYLPDVVECYVKIFADDTKVVTHVQCEEDCHKLQGDLERLSQWSDMWQLKFNVSKCGVMRYGHQPTQNTYRMSEEGSYRDLGVMEEEKDLGVKFDLSSSQSMQQWWQTTLLEKCIFSTTLFKFLNNIA